MSNNVSVKDNSTIVLQKNYREKIKLFWKRMIITNCKIYYYSLSYSIKEIHKLIK